MFVALNDAPYAVAQLASVTIGTVACSSCVVAGQPFAQVVPQPMIVAVVPGAHSPVSLGPTIRSGSCGGGAAVEMCSSATSLLGSVVNWLWRMTWSTR